MQHAGAQRPAAKRETARDKDTRLHDQDREASVTRAQSQSEWQPHAAQTQEESANRQEGLAGPPGTSQGSA